MASSRGPSRSASAVLPTPIGPFERDVAELQSRADDIIATVFRRSACVRASCRRASRSLCHAISVRRARRRRPRRARLPAPPCAARHLRREDDVDSSARGSARCCAIRSPAAPAPPPLPSADGAAHAPPVAPPPPPPDLVSAAGRRRGARAAPRGAGRRPCRAGGGRRCRCCALLTIGDPEVRQMAAFALGLIGDRRARDPLVTALDDPSPMVQASAAEALGLLGDPAAAAADWRAWSRSPVGRARAAAGRRRRRASRHARRRVSTWRLRARSVEGVSTSSRLPCSMGRDSRVCAGGRWLLRCSGWRTSAGWPALMALAQDAAAVHARVRREGTRRAEGSSRGPAADSARLGQRPRRRRSRPCGRSDALAIPRPPPPLLKIIQATPPRRIRASKPSAALGGIKAPGVAEISARPSGDPSPPIRAAALRSRAAASDPEGFVTVLSGLDPDPDWSVRAALATILGSLDADRAAAIDAMLSDTDQRVIPSVLAALVKLKAPDAARLLLDQLKADDPPVRAAAAAALGELKPAAGAPALVAAYQLGQRDTMYTARAAALDGARQVRHRDATPLLDAALADHDWAVRVTRRRAAEGARSVERRRRANPPGADAAVAQRRIGRHGSSLRRCPRRCTSTWIAARFRSSWRCSTRR